MYTFWHKTKSIGYTDQHKYFLGLYCIVLFREVHTEAYILVVLAASHVGAKIKKGRGDKKKERGESSKHGAHPDTQTYRINVAS